MFIFVHRAADFFFFFFLHSWAYVGILSCSFFPSSLTRAFVPAEEKPTAWCSLLLTSRHYILWIWRVWSEASFVLHPQSYSALMGCMPIVSLVINTKSFIPDSSGYRRCSLMVCWDWQFLLAQLRLAQAPFSILSFRPEQYKALKRVFEHTEWPDSTIQCCPCFKVAEASWIPWWASLLHSSSILDGQPELGEVLVATSFLHLLIMVLTMFHRFICCLWNAFSIFLLIEHVQQ